jgi:hypothetical protein
MRTSRFFYPSATTKSRRPSVHRRLDRLELISIFCQSADDEGIHGEYGELLATSTTSVGFRLSLLGFSFVTRHCFGRRVLSVLRKPLDSIRKNQRADWAAILFRGMHVGTGRSSPPSDSMNTNCCIEGGWTLIQKLTVNCFSS